MCGSGALQMRRELAGVMRDILKLLGHFKMLSIMAGVVQTQLQAMKSHIQAAGVLSFSRMRAWFSAWRCADRELCGEVPNSTFQVSWASCLSQSSLHYNVT